MEKLIAAHDLFPRAKLYANDSSERRLQKIRENLTKYKIEAELSTGYGEEFHSLHHLDLAIVDVPCSNSAGSFNKRPEARWRLTPEEIRALTETQFKLLQSAKELISDHGVIWYITCSILKDENEDMISRACKDWG